MIYDFDEIINRVGTNNAKYDERIKKFGTDDIIPMWIADMDFKTAKPIIDKCVKRAEHGVFGYVSRPKEYYKAAIDFEKRRHDWEIREEDISFAVGIVPAISELVREFTENGDKVLIQTPVYPEFYDVVEAWEGREVIENRLILTDGKYDIDFCDFEEKLKEGPKLFILCNPHNPIGRIWTRKELEKMLNLCVEYQVPVVSDEIHGDLELFGNKYTPAGNLSEEIQKNTISCFSASKSFNLAGLQACNVVFHNDAWKRRFDTFWKGFDIHRNNCFSLVAFQTAWEEGEEWLDQVISYIEKNMLFCEEYISKNIPELKFNPPQATYLAWLDFSELKMTPKELDEFFIKKAKVGMNNGNDFCRSLTGFMRMNMACPREIVKEALKRIDEEIKKL